MPCGADDAESSRRRSLPDRLPLDCASPPPFAKVRYFTDVLHRSDRRGALRFRSGEVVARRKAEGDAFVEIEFGQLDAAPLRPHATFDPTGWREDLRSCVDPRGYAGRTVRIVLAKAPAVMPQVVAVAWVTWIAPVQFERHYKSSLGHRAVQFNNRWSATVGQVERLQAKFEQLCRHFRRAVAGITSSSGASMRDEGGQITVSATSTDRSATSSRPAACCARRLPVG